MFNKRMQYVIKTCPSENVQELQNLLNEMSMNGWELYSMHEVEADEGFVYNCIFMMETPDSEGGANSDVINISTFKSQMEKMLSPKLTPYELCLEIQSKIKDQKTKIAKIKKELEGEAPASVSRKKLNDKISAGLKELEDLKQKLAHATSPDEMYSKLQTEKLGIYLSEELLGYVDPDQDLGEEELVAETVKSRLKLTEDLGFVIPKIIFQDDEQLNPYEFAIRIRGLDVYKALVYPNYTMYFEDDIHLDKKEISNTIKDIDYITGKNIVWVDKNQSKDFWEKGLSGSQFIARALEFVSVKYVDDLLDYNELDKYLDIVSKKNSYLVANLIPDYISLSDLRFILTSLITERISIKDITYIFEKMNDYAEDNTKLDLLKKIRLALSRQICHNFADENGTINAIEISEESLDALTVEDFDAGDEVVRIDAEFAEKLAEEILNQAKEFNMDIIKLVVPIDYRQLLFTILTNYLNNIVVLAREEISCNCQLEILASV